MNFKRFLKGLIICITVVGVLSIGVGIISYYQFINHVSVGQTKEIK